MKTNEDSKDKLFDVPENLSPRLQWMKDHQVTSEYIPPTSAKYSVTSNGITVSDSSEMEALSKLASKLGVQMWDESFNR